jgi:hypothetical protein
MKAPRHASRARQRGIAGVLGVMFLIVAAIFALRQTLGITASNSNDSLQQLYSTQAFFLAESGLERAQYILVDGACSDVDGPTTPYTLGSGSFTLTATGDSVTCNVTSTGAVGPVSRTMSRGINFNAVYGKDTPGCNATLKIKNIYNVPAIVVFDLAYSSAPNGSTPVVAGCTNGNNINVTPANGTRYSWRVYNNNDPIVGNAGITDDTVAANQTVTSLTNSLSHSAYLSIVAGIFPGNGSTPTQIKSYWNEDISPPGTSTFYDFPPATSYGQTTSGVASTNVNSCGNSPGTAPRVNCNAWCSGADTLVFGMGIYSSQGSVPTAAVTFNTAGTNGYPPQSVVMGDQNNADPSKPLVSFPTVYDSQYNYANIYYYYNPYYMSAGNSGTASTGGVTGTIGQTLTGSVGASLTGFAGVNLTTPTATVSGTTATLGAITYAPGSPNVSVGNAVASSNCPAIAVGNTVSSTSGSVRITVASGGSNCSSVVLGFSTINLHVSVSTPPSGALFAGDTVFNGATNLGTISSLTSGKGFTGDYTLNAARWTPVGTTMTTRSTHLYTCSAGCSAPAQTGAVFASDSISGAGIAGGTTISALGSGGTTGCSSGCIAAGTGTNQPSYYNLSGAAQGPTGSIAITEQSTKLYVKTNPAGALYPSDDIYKATDDSTLGTISSSYPSSNSGTINAAPNGGTVPMYFNLASGAQQFPTEGLIKTRHVKVTDSGGGTPAATMLVQVYSGTGMLPAGTTVASSPSPGSADFHLSATPTTALNSATVCGGICALFNEPSNGSSTTQFRVAHSATPNVSKWAGGFTCLHNIDPSKIIPITQTTPQPTVWGEAVH